MWSVALKIIYIITGLSTFFNWWTTTKKGNLKNQVLIFQMFWLVHFLRLTQKGKKIAIQSNDINPTWNHTSDEHGK